MNGLLRAILFLTCAGLISCASYQTKVSESRSLIRSGQISEAIEKLKPLAEKKSDDQLVYLLDYGMALHLAGRYEESNQVFLKADKIAEIVDYHSVSNITLATLGSEEMVQYKGESYEKVLINVYLALNYLMLGKFDDAMVEVRRVNEKVNRIRLDGREDFEQNPFAHYLSAILWESDQKFDDAYISYEQSYKLDGSNPLLPQDLIRSAKRARREDAYQKWKREFPQITENKSWYDRNTGELIVVFQDGWGPEKHYSLQDHRFPELHPVRSRTQSALVKVDGVGEFSTTTVYDVERTSIHTLAADYSWMAARKVGAFIAKEVVADQIRQKNETLGNIAWLAMHLSDRADLRQWSTLPRAFQIARISLPPGVYQISIQGRDGTGGLTSESTTKKEVRIQPGRKAFISWRALQ